MPLHEIEDCPEAVTIDLWLFALKMVVDVHNATPGPSGHYPEETFSKQRVGQTGLLVPTLHQATRNQSGSLFPGKLYTLATAHAMCKWYPLYLTYA
jgi:hypothetical protein